MPVNWKRFFESYRLLPIESDADLLYQVGKTVGGRPISAEQFESLLQDCRRALDLRESDTLLDLCAGNGVITCELASHVAWAVGIDFSTPYIENAQKHKARANLRYVVHDVADLENCDVLKTHPPISRVLCYDALAYLKPAQVERMIEYVAARGTPQVRLLLGNVLDKARIWSFFNTWPRKLNYVLRVQFLGREFGLGRWWTRSELVAMAGRHGFDCEFREQSSILNTAHYRFDVLLRREGAVRS
jgi:cyclopropane fatty-acyl-phospholipid synthase-like methyltransferase